MMFEIICGEGGIPVDEFWYLKNTRIAELLMQGIARRSRTPWEVGRLQAAIQANSMSRKPIEPEDIVRLPWIDDPEDDRTEEEIQQAVDKAVPMLEAMIKNIK